MLFTSERWPGIQGLGQLRDGGLIVVADLQLWHLSYPDGKARRISNDSNEYRSLSVSEDSSTLVSSRSGRLSNIWVKSLAEAAASTRQVTTRVGYNEDPFWTPDGKIVYTSNASGNIDIWIMDQDGANPIWRLTMPYASRPSHYV